MLFKIRKMHKLDNVRVYNFLKNEVDTKDLMKNIKEHIRNGICYKLQDSKDEIKGIFLAMKFKDNISLTYYFLADEIRKKPISLKFFLVCMQELDPLLPILIVKNKNFYTYQRYFKEIEGTDLLIFSGFRDSYIKKLEECL